MTHRMTWLTWLRITWPIFRHAFARAREEARELRARREGKGPMVWKFSMWTDLTETGGSARIRELEQEKGYAVAARDHYREALAQAMEWRSGARTTLKRIANDLEAVADEFGHMRVVMILDDASRELRDIAGR